ncbi:thiamine diphosphokinase [Sporosarcina thermotolerans]|uniref:Thiamine diphosphokinase n=1 Tax=Sporosarcina thermotolerans TaxID=633404 RepID=A0AAW9A5I9_9BACL|nr:thiamine diphosphokinase [Sporosarcina thermotolerans]MDW0115778.1 thiamine diphosphokinase [Sporosarcina thermotolerans]WHT46976.1 thiamine diphosphokinase [Sporosarcina thermotolerans]
MKRVVICAGGPVEELPDLLALKSEGTIFIGVDRGSLHLLERGIVPLEAVGDFDSVTKSEFEMIQSAVDRVDAFNAMKDETDTELAVTRALTHEPDEIILIGVTGGRIDHFESALQLLYRLQIEYEDVSFIVKNISNELYILKSGTHLVNKNEGLPYVSFFPFGSTVEGITLTGFKYETVNARMEMGMTKFTSNEPIEEVCTISFRKGICLMVRSSDS